MKRCVLVASISSLEGWSSGWSGEALHVTGRGFTKGLLRFGLCLSNVQPLAVQLAPLLLLGAFLRWIALRFNS